MNDIHHATRSATVNAQIVPAGTLDVLSRDEIARLRDATSSGLHALLRSCALAVLTSGAMQDSARAMLDQYPDFDIQVLQQDRGVKLDLKNAPAQAFVDGKIIRGTNELLFAVVRDIVYESTRLESGEESPTRCSTSCAMRGCYVRASTRTSWSAGAAIPFRARNTTTPRRSATSSACAAWTSAPAAGRAR
jgi:hypothetical protein